MLLGYYSASASWHGRLAVYVDVRFASRDSINTKPLSCCGEQSIYSLLSWGYRPGKNTLENFLEQMRNRFEKVYFVPGNHEFYRNEYHQAKRSLKAICDKWDNVIFMDRTTVIENDKFRLIGATLWSHVPEESSVVVSKSLSDYSSISIIDNEQPKRKVIVEDTNKWHAKDLEYIKEQVQLAKEENQVAIILTHHAPLLKGTSSPQHEGGEIQSAFASDLKYLMGSPIAVWCFGHTHYSSNQVVDGTRVISNQLGYLMKHEANTNFQAGLVVTVHEDGSSETTQ